MKTKEMNVTDRKIIQFDAYWLHPGSDKKDDYVMHEYASDDSSTSQQMEVALVEAIQRGANVIDIVWERKTTFGGFPLCPSCGKALTKDYLHDMGDSITDCYLDEYAERQASGQVVPLHVDPFDEAVALGNSGQEPPNGPWSNSPVVLEQDTPQGWTRMQVAIALTAAFIAAFVIGFATAGWNWYGQ